jgi:hypothetical protein
MIGKQPEYFFRSVDLTLDQLWLLASNPGAVFNYRPGYAKIYFVQVPSISSLHALLAGGRHGL